MTMEVLNPAKSLCLAHDLPLTHGSVNPCKQNDIINNNSTEMTEGSHPEKNQGSHDLEAHDTSVVPVLSGVLREEGSQALLKTEQGMEVVHQQWKLEVLGNKSAKTNSLSMDGVQSKRRVFEKWSSKGQDSQRPLAKRQLSVESSTQASRVLKKTAVRQQEAQPTQASVKLQTPSTPSTPRTCNSSRKTRKDLFFSTEVFQQVDTQAIKEGKELRKQKVFSVQAITKAITREAKSDLEKLRAIWVWLCHNIEYDLDGYLGLSEKLCSPEQVIEAGRGVCCGYSSICQEMCREVGIECLEVPGHGKGIDYQQGQSYQNIESNHMWNTVQLGGHWYLLDACWGAGKVDIKKKAFIKRYEDFYFLADPEDFIDSHYPAEQKWQLLDTPITLEEFEKRVFKTSQFYRLGLKLMKPRHSLLVTEGGEATVSMGFSCPLDFTYQISQQGCGEPSDVSSSFGLLTVTQLSMQLRLLPPTKGTYDIMVFARPSGSSSSFIWVCSFLLECPEPKPMEELPENPFQSWGLQPSASCLGLGQCNLGAEPAMVETGALELQLHTLRPLMMICELIHKDLDQNLAKRCLATQIQPDLLTCHIVCPYRGFYRLSVFVRDYEQTEESFQNAGNFLLCCTRNPINLNQLFPLSLSSSCGPGIRTINAGLSKFSHTGAIISTQQGKCNITFHSPPELDLHAVLTREHKQPAQPLLRHVFFTYTDSKVTLSVTLPKAGIYKLGLYGKNTPGPHFSLLCDFVLRSSSDVSWPPFPCTYSVWKKGCVLFEPRGGLLEPQSQVHFRVRVPGAQRVIVVGETQTDLRLNKSRVWEGEAFTGSPGSQLKLASSLGGEATDMAVLMAFDVLSQSNEE
uniref:Kyphoscoliosis peptidase-like n=1 Tax=Paramormyrops kingsleyae TaxID=1676925 RepID=A0A3B3SC53_9TELE|nr:kyphoscoliosis peptidase-like [Paramormyrops kingsleyae]